MALVGLLGLRDLSHSEEGLFPCTGLIPLSTDNTFLGILVGILLILGEAVEYLLDLGVDLVDILHPRLKLLPPLFAVEGWVLARSNAAPSIGGLHVVIVDYGFLYLSDLAEHRLFRLS